MLARADDHWAVLLDVSKRIDWCIGHIPRTATSASGRLTMVEGSVSMPRREPRIDSAKGSACRC